MADEGKKISKMDKKIMVVPTERLFGDKEDGFSMGQDHFQGFRPANEVDYMARILTHYAFERRGDVENDSKRQQPIAYTLVVNPKTRQVFVYQRAAEKGKYDEKRLQGKIAVGVGGHINEIDVGNSKNPIQASLEREMREEVRFQGGRIPRGEYITTLGCINDESDPVGQVHFGIISVAETDATVVLPNAPEIARGGKGRIQPGLKTIPELEEIFGDEKYVVEGWTKIALAPLKKYLGV